MTKSRLRRKTLSIRSTSILYIKNVPNEIKAQFKAYCARRQISMTDAIIKMMREKIGNASHGNKK